MLTQDVYGDSRLSLWLRVREFAVPATMIETATTRRRAGDWAGACAAAGIDVDLDLRRLARTHGRDLAARIRADLRHLAPDLLRWHLPRIAPDGLLRPGLTLTLARYEGAGYDGSCPVHLVVRTPPAWAEAGQRFSLALYDRSRPEPGEPRHPHPRPDRRFRLDLHRHLWDARRSDELRIRAGAGVAAAGGGGAAARPELPATVPDGRRFAVDRWAAEAAILLRAEGRPAGAVTVRLGTRRHLLLDLAPGGDGSGPPALRITTVSGDAAASVTGDRGARVLPVLPDAATRVAPDLELLRAGLVEAGRLHPLVAAALEPGYRPAGPRRDPYPPGGPRPVECRGARHRIGPVGGVLTALDHDPDEIRREELLVALGGTPLPCLRAIDEAHRRPDCLTGVRERLDHGDTAGALAVVEGLLGPDAVLRGGALRDELRAAAQRRLVYGLFRAGLAGPGPGRLLDGRSRPRGHRPRPRLATAR
ncbi:hypothetical protein AB4039_38915 [Streptomyces sp. M-16]|uniref:hypothetical protein n=1 Tax=Streptomyces sp. M-16 TaxID=3233040 RepID=UPI003F9CE4D1